jgi:hypothetical protein
MTAAQNEIDDSHSGRCEFDIELHRGLMIWILGADCDPLGDCLTFGGSEGAEGPP